MAFNRLRNRSGTSLAEVLVVAIILVTGILVVMRVFPVGFSSLRHAENVSIAGRLAQQEMDKWNNRAANLPAGILPIDENGNLLLDLVPGPPINPGNAPLDPLGHAYKNSECFRKVIGEVTKIPVGTYFDIPGESNFGAMYVLGFSPIKVVWDADTPKNLVIYGGSMRGRAMDSTDGREPWRRMGPRYAIDYDRGLICFASVGQYREYRVSLSYWLGSPPQLYHVVDGVVAVPANTNAWIPLSSHIDLPSGAKIDEGSESVARAFIYQPDPWTSDPYEYKLVDPIAGIIAFNPAGNGQFENTELGIKPLEAHINYDIMDPQIISEERTVPLTAPYQVKLTLPFIKKKGQAVDPTNPAYLGIGGGAQIEFGPGATARADMLIVNPADGAKLLPRSDDPDLPGDFVLDEEGFRTGLVKFPSPYARAVMPSGVVYNNYPIAGKTLRFYYQADNDWSVQLHKAYERYVNGGYTTPDPNVDISYRQFLTFDDSPGRLFFKLCDADKTVAVTYKWKTEAGGRNVYHTEVGETHQLDKYTDIGGNRFVYLDLRKGPIHEIVSVMGISVKARALWREREQWMYSDVESSMRRRPSEL